MRKRVKVLIVCLACITLLSIINYCRYSAPTDYNNIIPNKTSDNPKKANSYTIENSIAVHAPNGILCFPYIFGERIYMYDIEQEKAMLVKNITKPKYCIWSIGVEKSYMVVEDEGWDGSGGNHIIYYPNGKCTSVYYRKNYSETPCYLTENNIYYIDYSYANRTYRIVCDSNTGLGSYDVFSDEKGDYIDDFLITGDTCFVETITAQELDERVLIVKSEGKDSVYIKFESDILHIVKESDDTAILVCQDGRILRVDKRGNITLIANSDSEFSDILDAIPDHAVIKSDILYFADDSQFVYSVNLKNGEIHTVIVCEKPNSALMTTSIDFSKDYIIALETYNGREKAIIYDYNGNEIVKKHFL